MRIWIPGDSSAKDATGPAHQRPRAGPVDGSSRQDFSDACNVDVGSYPLVE